MVYDLVPFVLPVALVLIVLMVAVDAIVHAF